MKRFNSQGISAALMSGAEENIEVKKGVREGNYDVVFFTPELLIGSKRWRSVLTSEMYTQRLKGLVIDEAHCVSKWSVCYITLI